MNLNLAAAWRALRGHQDVRTVLVRRPLPDQDPMSYAGGQVSRLDADFQPSLVGPNMTAEQTLELGRARATALCQDNDIIAGARETVINNVVGPSGIMPQPNTGDRELDKVIRDLWWAEAGAVDPSRELPMAEVQREFVGEVFRVGESLAHFPIAPAWGRFGAGPAVEIVDTDRMPIADWRMPAGGGMNLPGVPAGHYVRQGVEFDQFGRRVAYHVLVQHPSDNSWWTNPADGMKTIRLEASTARLGFRRRRPGTIRGVPWTISVINTTRMEDGFQKAALAQARLAASLGLIFVGASGRPVRAGSTETSPFLDADGNPLSKIGPGMMGRTAENGDVKIVGGNLPGPTFAAAVEVMLRRVAAGLGISYAVLARDFSKTTFSASRAEALEDRKGYRACQELVVVHLAEPFYRRKIDWWVLSGKLNLTAEQKAKAALDPSWLYRAVWIMPGWEWVNPQQEAQASQIGLDAGILDPYTVCAQSGQHAEDVIDARLRAEKYEIEQRAKMGLPPKAPKAAASPAASPAAPADPNDPSEPAEDPNGDWTGGGGAGGGAGGGGGGGGSHAD